jgi:flavin-binding protein dodecin
MPRVFVVLVGRAADNARMAEHVYKKIEIVGSSSNGMEEAVHNALSRASETIRNMRWFEVVETRGYIDDGKVEHWQVTLKIGFTLEE